MHFLDKFDHVAFALQGFEVCLRVALHELLMFFSRDRGVPPLELLLVLV
jgi:hypothetical protein